VKGLGRVKGAIFELIIIFSYFHHGRVKVRVMTLYYTQSALAMKIWGERRVKIVSLLSPRKESSGAYFHGHSLLISAIFPSILGQTHSNNRKSEHKMALERLQRFEELINRFERVKRPRLKDRSNPIGDLSDFEFHYHPFCSSQ
jgi:hypothetical protein